MHAHFFVALTLEVHVAAVLLPFQVHSTIAKVGNRTSAIAPDAQGSYVRRTCALGTGLGGGQRGACNVPPADRKQTVST